jgi:hypothetical protein
MMTIAQVVQVLSMQIGKPVGMSPHGTIRLNFENRLDLILETRADFDLYLYGVLGEMPTEDAQNIYQRLLEWQLLGQALDQASFAIDAAHRQVLIQRHLDLRVTEPHDLVEAIQDLFARLDHWQTRWKWPVEGTELPASVGQWPEGFASEGWLRA